MKPEDRLKDNTVVQLVSLTAVAALGFVVCCDQIKVGYCSI